MSWVGKNRKINNRGGGGGGGGGDDYSGLESREETLVERIICV